jgi:hypothetical protein
VSAFVVLVMQQRRVDVPVILKTAEENEDILQDFLMFWQYNMCERSENE